MPNPSGKNTPSSFEGFTQGTPYGDKKKAAALTKSAPLAGDGAHALGSARRATEIALKSAEDQRNARASARSAQAPVIPQPPAEQSTDPFQTIWAAAASDPGASSLVREYASLS